MSPPPAATVTSRFARTVGDPLIAASLGATLIGAIEIVRIGATRPGLAFTLLAVFAFTGAIAGGLQLATGAIARPLRAPVAALVHTAPALIIWIPVAGTLFEGAFATTLPGARVMPYVLPPLLWLLSAVAAWLGGVLRRRAGRLGDAILGGALALLLIAVWIANHRMFRSGYLDLHAGLTACELVIAGLGLRLALPPDEASLPRLARVGVAVALTAGFAVAALYGLTRADDRKLVTDHGDDTRHLVRVWRSLIDLDRDGSSAILGGGDCDDFDASRHPGARDIPGDGIDQDCDGVDATPHVESPTVVARKQSLADWRAQPDVTAALARTSKMNVLIVSIDVLRYDLLAPDAPHRADFPRLTKLLDESVWFQHAEAPAAGTDVSLPTFVTGRWDPFQPLDTTLIEAMKASGRRTGVIFPREVLRYVAELLLTRGVDDVMRIISDTEKRDVGDKVTAGITTDKSLGFLDQAGAQPWFLWAHYFDVHEHHQLTVPADLAAEVDPGASELEHGYRAFAHGIDTQIGRLLDELDRRGLTDHTIVVLFADHGESLHEEPRLPDNHGTVVYQTLIHIPLAIRIPGVAPHVDLEPASLVDLAPTLAVLTGATPPPSLDGVDLLPSLLSAPLDLRHHDRALVSHEDQQWAVIEWPWKLLVRPAENLIELYDLDTDPGEHHDLAADHPDEVASLKSRFGDFPDVPMDRTRAGRAWREEQAKPPKK